MTLAAAVAEYLDTHFDYDRPERIGVAVSGGGDSMALLHLVARWARGHGFEPVAATVDHGLRKGSAEEAQKVAGWCADAGMDHDILRWQWDGQGNLQDAARRGRRHVIAQWARARGIDTVGLGHTRDDQAETVIMRLARGSGVDGLAGMRDGVISDGVYWIRPLLDHSRQELRDWLGAEGIAWLEDPSNDDPRFDRVRARQAIASLGLDSARLSRTARQMAAAAAVLDRAACQLAQDAVTQEGGDLIIDRARLRAALHDTRWRLVAGAVQFVGDRRYRPRFAALEDFAQAVLDGRGRTLGGVRSLREGKTAMRLTAEHRVPPATPDRDNFHRWFAMH